MLMPSSKVLPTRINKFEISLRNANLKIAIVVLGQDLLNNSIG